MTDRVSAAYNYRLEGSPPFGRHRVSSHFQECRVLVPIKAHTWATESVVITFSRTTSLTMFFVLPATPTVHSTSRLPPQSYERPNQDYYQVHSNVPRIAVPPYPASQQRFFHQYPVEELEEREYLRALAVISNYRRRQAEKEATIRRQRQAEAARRSDLYSLAAEFEQRRQEAEFLTSDPAEVIRTRYARARLAATERQIAVNEFMGQLKGVPPVCRVFSS